MEDQYLFFQDVRKAQWLNDITSELNMIKKGRMGARKQRRYENGLFLLIKL